MSRKEDNLKILETLRSYLIAYPDMRLGQALVNLGVIENRLIDGTTGLTETLDPFYEEPEDTLKRMKQRK